MKLLRGLNWSAGMARVVLPVNKPTDVDLASPLSSGVPDVGPGTSESHTPEDRKRG